LPKSDDPFAGDGRAVLSLVVVTAFAWLSFIFLPALIDNYVRGYGFSATRAGVLASIEVGSLTIMALLVTPSVNRRDKRILCAVGAIAVLFGNVLSLVSNQWESIGVSRLIVGGGLGLVVSATSALPALSRRSERLYALGQFALCAFGGLLIFAVPPLVDRLGIHAIFWLEIAVSVIALVGTVRLPAGIRVEERRASNGPVPLNTDVIRALAAAGLYYVVQTALWAFAGQAGQHAGLNESSVDFYLGASAMCGILGATIALGLGTRLGIYRPLAFGFLSQALFGLVLYTGSRQATFIPAVLLITVSSVFVTPYLLATAARLDELGRAASAAGAILNLGATVGPVAAGLTASRLGYAWIGYASVVCLGIGFALITRPAHHVDSWESGRHDLPK
jgi:predicted MFS family arabinose efflux permease